MRSRTPLLAAPLALAAAVALTACSSTADAPSPATATTVAANHLHDVAFDADGQLLVSTHDGVFRSTPAGDQTDRLEGERFDAMGLAVLDGTIVASGHPGPTSSSAFPAPSIGLMAYSSGVWERASTAEPLDYHILATTPSAAGLILAVASGGQGVLRSTDAGATWSAGADGEIVDLAIAPDDPSFVVAATTSGVQISDDGGVTLIAADGAPLLSTLAATGGGRVLGVDLDGQLWEGWPSEQRWQAVSTVAEGAIAMTIDNASGALAVVASETVLLSNDAGVTWTRIDVPA